MSGYVFWVTGDKQRGMGHIVRSLQLGAELVRRGCGVTFCTEHETPGAARLQKSIYAVEDYHPLDWSWMARYAPMGATLIIDVENGPTAEFLEAAGRASFARIVVIAGSGYALQDWNSAQALSDLVVCQSIIETKSDLVKVLSGVEYIMINPAFAQCQPDFSGPIVVSMGGTDPHELTPRALDALEGIDREILAPNGNADSLFSFLNGASLFIGALGMSAYEAAAAGVPSLLSAWTDDHERTTLELQKRGIARNLGTWNKFDGEFLRSVTDGLLDAQDEWQTMSDAGKHLVDGNGAIRVANALENDESA